MKILLTLLSVLFFTYTQAQTQDLIALAKGNYLGMNALFDENGSLFGYISIYDYGKSGEKTKKFEYVILDKNLNPFANNTFDGDITAANYIGYINFDGKVVLKPYGLDGTLISKREMFYPSSMIIDLESNMIEKKLFYDFDNGTFNEKHQNDSWAENKKEYKAEIKELGYHYVSNVVEIKEGGYLVFEYDDYRSYIKNNKVSRYGEGKEKLWEYSFNDNGSRKEAQVLYFLAKSEKYYYGLLRERVKTKSIYSLIVLDMKTGKEVHNKEIPDSEDVLPNLLSFRTFSYGELDNDKTYDDTIVIVGRTGPMSYYSGISRMIIDKNTFAIDIKTLSYKDDFKQFIPKIKANGAVEKGYFLDPRDIFFLRDGSIGILFEKYKIGDQYTAQRTSDMIYVYTDKDFNITDTKLLEKEKTRWANSDYMFSQNLNDDKDLVFFYRDYQKDEETKDKNWNLFINTFINGKYKQEMIPISSKENYIILPYIAKEGYILLQEYNTKAKYNQIRLERLNY